MTFPVREKVAHLVHPTHASLSSSPPSTPSTIDPATRAKLPPLQNVDEAFVYLNRQEHQDGQADAPYTASLRHRIDWRIVPIMFACYTMQFLDKVLLNVRDPRPHFALTTEI